MQETAYLLFYPFFMVELSQALVAIDRIDDAKTEIDKALELANKIDYRWLVPDIKRNKAEILVKSDPRNVEEAEQLLSEALVQSRTQGAQYWEFCAAVSRAELQYSHGDVAGARALLTPYYDRLSKDTATPMIERAEKLRSNL